MTNEIQEIEMDQPLGWRHNGAGKIIGHVLASVSLLPCVIFWVDLDYAGIAEEPGLRLSAFQWSTIIGVAVALAAIATVLRSKLWRVALPVLLLMFFFTVYGLGS